MAAYIISRIRITDSDRFAEYREASLPVAERFGAKYLARSDYTMPLDGSDDGRRLVIIEFPDMDRLQAFWNSPEYQAARKLRLGAGDIDIVAVPGLD